MIPKTRSPPCLKGLQRSSGLFKNTIQSNSTSLRLSSLQCVHLFKRWLSLIMKKTKVWNGSESFQQACSRGTSLRLWPGRSRQSSWRSRPSSNKQPNLKPNAWKSLPKKKKKKNLKIKSSTSSSSCSSFLPPPAGSLCLRRLSESESSVWGSSRRRTASHLYLEGGKEIKNKGQGQTGTSVNQSLGHGGMKDVRERNLSWQRAPSSCFSWILMRPLNWASLFHSLGCILFWKKKKIERLQLWRISIFELFSTFCYGLSPPPPRFFIF